jgi:hypothetical protein
MENSHFSLSLSDRQFQQISIILSELSAQLPARYVLLMSVAGQVIAEWGQRGTSNPFKLAALVAGEAIPRAETSQMIGDSEADRIVVLDGPDERLFAAEAGPHFALTVIASCQVSVEWARLVVPYAVHQLRSLEVKDPAPGGEAV